MAPSWLRNAIRGKADFNGTSEMIHERNKARTILTEGALPVLPMGGFINLASLMGFTPPYRPKEMLKVIQKAAGIDDDFVLMGVYSDNHADSFHRLSPSYIASKYDLHPIVMVEGWSGSVGVARDMGEVFHQALMEKRQAYPIPALQLALEMGYTAFHPPWNKQKKTDERYVPRTISKQVAWLSRYGFFCRVSYYPQSMLAELEEPLNIEHDNRIEYEHHKPGRQITGSRDQKAMANARLLGLLPASMTKPFPELRPNSFGLPDDVKFRIERDDVSSERLVHWEDVCAFIAIIAEDNDSQTMLLHDAVKGYGLTSFGLKMRFEPVFKSAEAERAHNMKSAAREKDSANAARPLMDVMHTPKSNLPSPLDSEMYALSTIPMSTMPSRLASEFDEFEPLPRARETTRLGGGDS